MLVQVKVKVRSNEVTARKYSTTVVWRMLYGSFGTYNSMVTLIFTFDPRSGQVRVKKVKMWKSKFSLKNMPILSSFASAFPKCHLCRRTTLKNSQTRVSKSDVITLTCFLGHCTAKNKDFGLRFCTLFLALSSIRYIPFFGYRDFWRISFRHWFDFVGIDFWKIDILIFGGQKPTILKIRDSHFVESVIWHLLGVCWLRFTLNC